MKHIVDENEWAPVHGGIAGPDVPLCEGTSGKCQSDVSTAKHLAFALQSCCVIQIFGGAICGEQLLSPHLAP
jgi:hypothetical protein